MSFPHCTLIIYYDSLMLLELIHLIMIRLGKFQHKEFSRRMIIQFDLYSRRAEFW